MVISSSAMAYLSTLEDMITKPASLTMLDITSTHLTSVAMENLGVREDHTSRLSTNTLTTTSISSVSYLKPSTSHTSYFLTAWAAP